MDHKPQLIAAAEALGIDAATLPKPDAPSPVNIAPATIQKTDGDLSLLEAEVIRPLLPPEPRQEGSLPNVAILNGLLWAQRTGRKLTQLPARYGKSDALRKRVERWSVAGVWDRLLSELDHLTLSAGTRAAIRKLALAHARRGERIRKFREAGSRGPA